MVEFAKLQLVQMQTVFYMSGYHNAVFDCLLFCKTDICIRKVDKRYITTRL